MYVCVCVCLGDIVWDAITAIVQSGWNEMRKVLRYVNSLLETLFKEVSKCSPVHYLITIF